MCIRDSLSSIQERGLMPGAKAMRSGAMELQMSPFPPFDLVEGRVRASGRVGDPDYVAPITLHTKSVLRDLRLYKTMAGAL
eukprot:9037676-Alexandrium_andersonii.AAC.1